MRQERSRLAKFLARKISKKKVETSGVAALTFGDLIYDMVRVDQRYIDGVNFSRPSKDLSSVFKIGKQNLSESPEPLNVLHERNYAGSSFVTPDMFGNYQYGSELLNITFNPTLESELATYNFDDDGTNAEKNT